MISISRTECARGIRGLSLSPGNEEEEEEEEEFHGEVTLTKN